MKNIIKKNLSIYNGKYIYDKTILKYIGMEIYSILMDMDKNLYEDLINYKIEYTQKKLDIIDLNLTSIEIKTQIIAIILKDNSINVNITIKNFVNDNNNNNKIEIKTNSTDIYIDIFISLLFILSIIYVLYILGIINYIFKKNCTTEACIKNFTV